MAARIVAASMVGGVIFACFAPTQIVLRFETNLQARNPQTAIQIGVENAFKQGADGDGRIGELVVVPSDAHDALVEVKIALGIDGVDANTCLVAPANPRCVTAKRSYRFADHETRTFDVYLSSACLGIVCGPGQSCDARTSTCTDVRENATDPPPPPAAPPGADAGEDVTVPTDAPPEPPRDASVGPCGPSTIVQPTAGEPRILAGTTDQIYWLDATGRVRSRAKTTAAAPQSVGDDVETLAAAGAMAVWTRGTTVFGRTPAGNTVPCTIAEPASAIALHAGATANDLPVALFASGTSGVIRYASSVAGGVPCQQQAKLPTVAQAELVSTSTTLWARAATSLSGVSWTFPNESTWELTGNFGQTSLLAAGPNIATFTTVDQNQNTTLYRLTSPQMIAASVSIAGEVTGLAVDGSFFYWLDNLLGTAPITRLVRAPLASGVGPPAQIAAFPTRLLARGLVVDDSCIYTWATSVDDPTRMGSIIGIPKPSP